ncbi:flagellar hook protein FlgE, partial [Campylobacter coli]|nr:flagellar hook protein FlgE [Campylobacter coli]
IKSLDEAIAYINTFTAPNDTRDGTGVRAVKKADGSGIDFINDNAVGTKDNMKNIDLQVNANNSAVELINIRVAGNPADFAWNNIQLRPAVNAKIPGNG